LTTAKSKLGIAIIGLDHWYWALGCAYNISSNTNADLIAIADPNEEEVRRISQIYGAKEHSTDYHDILENPDVTGVVITSTTDQHATIAVDAAKAGKHILMGKPIARTLKEADKILSAAKKAGVKLFPMASGPLPDDYVLKLINNGRIGEPFAAHCSMLAIPPLRSPGVNEPGWFVDINKSPGGAFIDHAIYDIALLRHYMRNEVISVYAEMGKFKHKEYSVEDMGVAILRFRNGAIATVESSYSAITQSHSRKTIIGSEGELEVRRNMLSDGTSMISIWGKRERDGQRVLIENMPPEPVFTRNYVEKAVPMPPFAIAYRPTLDEFVNCIIEDRAPCSTGKDARMVLEICLAAYKSVETNRPVRIPLDDDVDVRLALQRVARFQESQSVPTL
jgi:predicted dehydrogenase